jgi:hypothetical protein
VPELRLDVEQSGLRKLSEVPEYEVWEDSDGDAVWSDGEHAMCVLSDDRGTIFSYPKPPEEIIVVRKLSDPITVRW